MLLLSRLSASPETKIKSRQSSDPGLDKPLKITKFGYDVPKLGHGDRT